LFKRFQNNGQNLKALLKYTIDDHKAGWSTLIPFKSTHGLPSRGPECDCHDAAGKPTGESGMREMTEAHAADSGCEYAYVFTTKKRVPTMLILSSVSSSGGKMIGMFGQGDPDSTWKQIAEVNLLGTEPNWKDIDAAAFEPAATTEGVSP
jgi:hypothetical protein